MSKRKKYPVVLRFEGMRPQQLARYIMHMKRNGGDTSHINDARTHLNRLLIGHADFAEQALQEIDEMRQENYARELEGLERRSRKSELQKRILEGPSDPWRPSKDGPMREVILTASAKWFEDFDWNGDTVDFKAREKAFEKRAVEWLEDNFGDDVIHARCDHDERAYHIHAIILPRALDQHGRRVLQPSIHPLIEDYEEAQNSVGVWFSGIGLKRGKRRKEAWRKAVEAGKKPKPKRRHKRTAQWREERDMALARKERQIADKEAAVLEREKTAETVLEIAENAADGQLEPVETESGKYFKVSDAVSQSEERARLDGILAANTAIAKSARGILVRGFAMLARQADERAKAQLQQQADDLAAAREALEAVLSKLPASIQSGLQSPLKSFIGAVRRLTPKQEARDDSNKDEDDSSK